MPERLSPLPNVKRYLVQNLTIPKGPHWSAGGLQLDRVLPEELGLGAADEAYFSTLCKLNQGCMAEAKPAQGTRKSFRLKQTSIIPSLPIVLPRLPKGASLLKFKRIREWALSWLGQV